MKLLTGGSSRNQVEAARKLSKARHRKLLTFGQSQFPFSQEQCPPLHLTYTTRMWISESSYPQFRARKERRTHFSHAEQHVQPASQAQFSPQLHPFSHLGQTIVVVLVCDDRDKGTRSVTAALGVDVNEGIQGITPFAPWMCINFE